MEGKPTEPITHRDIYVMVNRRVHVLVTANRTPSGRRQRIST